MTARNSFLLTALAVPLATVLVSSPLRADQTKAASGTDLTVGSSWVSGTAPTASDVAIWNSTSLGGNVSLAGSSAGTLNVKGFQIDGGTAAINLVGQGAGDTVNLGSSGITLASGGVDFGFGTSGNTLRTLNLVDNQTWSVSANRTLSLNYAWTIAGGKNLRIEGSGTFRHINSTSAITANFGGGTLTLANGITFSKFGTPGAMSISAPVKIEGNIGFLNEASSTTTNYINFTGGVDLGVGNSIVTVNNTSAGYDPTQANRLYVASLGFSSTISGSGTLTLRNANTGVNAGKVMTAYINAGSDNLNYIQIANLVVESNVELATSTSSNSLSANTALTLDGIFSQGGGATSVSQTIKSLAGSGTYVTVSTQNNSTNTLVIDGGVSTGTTTFSGVIKDHETEATRKVALTKNGTSTQILSGVNTYTGATTINAGTLLVNGSLGNTAVAVNGGVLGGNGTIAGATNINSGGTLSPGNSPGTLTFDGNLSLNSGSIYRFEGGDLVDVNGTLDLNNNWTLSLQSGFQNGGSTVLFTYTTLAGSPALTPGTNMTIDISGLGFTPGTLTLTDTGSSIVLNGISVIPEPGSVVLFGLGGMAVLFFRRRR